MKGQIIQKLGLLSFLATASAQNRSGNAIDISGSSHEATLDIPIWFTANYWNYTKGEEVIYQWEDDLWTRWKDDKKCTNSSNWSITYDSMTFSGYTGPRRVTVSVFGGNINRMVTASFDFILGDTLVGNIHTNQNNVTIQTPNYISTGNQTNLTALVHDPENWMKYRTKKANFLWYISSDPTVLPYVKIHAHCSTPSLLINLTQPGTYSIIGVVYMTLDNIIPLPAVTIVTSPAVTTLPMELTDSSIHSTHSIPAAPTLSTHPPPNAHNWTCDGWWPIIDHTDDYFFKVGYLKNSTTARDPIGIMMIKGETWLNNGDILKLNISCSGSGPWSSCYKTLDQNYNMTGNETCHSENLTIETNYNECHFNLSRYFRYDGPYAYLFIVSNDVSIMRRNITVNIYRGEPQPKLYSIILPVFCSLVVIIIIILGWVQLKRNKQRFTVEVADFDLLCPDEVECKNILDQIKDSLTSALSTHKEEEEDNESRRRKTSNIIVEKLSVLDFGSDSDFVHEY